MCNRPHSNTCMLPPSNIRVSASPRIDGVDGLSIDKAARLDKLDNIQIYASLISISMLISYMNLPFHALCNLPGPNTDLYLLTYENQFSIYTTSH